MKHIVDEINDAYVTLHERKQKQKNDKQWQLGH
jgi:hypothetical protein